MNPSVRIKANTVRPYRIEEDRLDGSMFLRAKSKNQQKVNGNQLLAVKSEINSCEYQEVNSKYRR